MLGNEFAGYTATASASGDRGRDGELYSGSEPTVMFQISIAADWRAKVRATATTIRENFPQAKVLVFVTNLAIGAEWDDIRDELRSKHGLFSEPRGRDWLLDRAAAGGAAEVAAEQLASEIVDPYLRDGVSERHQTLSTIENRAALTYLEMRWADDTHEKGLTRLAFEGLVRSVLRDTTSDRRMSRTEIKTRVRALLPSHDPVTVDRFTDSALLRLTRAALRHWQASDEFCLAHEERVRLAESMATLEVEERGLRQVVSDRVCRALGAEPDQELAREATERVRRVLDRFLLSRGEAFARSVVTGDLSELGLGSLQDFVLSDIGAQPPGPSRDVEPALIRDLVVGFLTESDERFHGYLVRLAGSYTLFAFLTETPDVQSAVAKMFTGGELGLDSSVILPLLADTLVEVDHRHFTSLLIAARDAGIDLWISAGAIEEVERHLNLTMVCARTRPADWRGDPPYLYARYLESGRALASIGTWVETFVGRKRPEDDLQLYLSDSHGVATRDLARVDAADPDLWTAALREWQRVHQARRATRPDYDEMMALHLARHDAESYVSILAHRQETSASPFGYSSWWLTLDRSSWHVHESVARELSRRNFAPPMMSPDFLSNYLLFGPLRRLVPRTLEAALPVVADVQLSQYVPGELVSIANEVRLRGKDLPEPVIQRQVRDALDEARLRRGTLAGANIEEIRDHLAVVD